VTSLNEDTRSKTVLLIDDDSDTLEVLNQRLRGRGVNVVTAHSADEALALYRLTPPDIIVAEMRLGLSDGYSFIRTMREYNREYRGFTPAIGITHSPHAADEQNAKTAGFDAYFRKPFDPEAIIDTIMRLLREQRRGTA
jgi:CheY-like chemotaxis protein